MKISYTALGRHTKRIAIFLLIVAVFFTGYFISHIKEAISEKKVSADSFSQKEKELRMTGYKYVNPLLECDIFKADMTSNSLLRHMKESLEEVIEDSGYANSAVYFRDLNNGPWLGINEKENFTPASLMKVPLMISALKSQEVEPSFLKKKIVYHKPETLEQNIVENIKFIDGKEYTVEELLKYSITHSSNEAAELILENINSETLREVYHDFNIADPASAQEENYMNVQNYAAFFRVLYNASYLEKDDSEKALEILSASLFKEGLVAGVPSSVAVAHKFGERRYADNGKEVKQLHDCGIIYAKNRNYLLCVMTRGDDFEKQKELIKKVSETVYEEFVLKNKQ